MSKLQMALESGQFGITDMQSACLKASSMGLCIALKAAGMARYMNENIPGIDVPEDMIARLAAAAEEGKEKGIKGLPAQVGIDMAAEIAPSVNIVQHQIKFVNFDETAYLSDNRIAIQRYLSYSNG